MLHKRTLAVVLAFSLLALVWAPSTFASTGERISFLPSLSAIVESAVSVVMELAELVGEAFDDDVEPPLAFDDDEPGPPVNEFPPNILPDG